MGRIAENDRLPAVDRILGHWASAEGEIGTDIQIKSGLGLEEVQAKRDEYHTMAEGITQLTEVDLPLLRSERDTVWGHSSTDKDGIWFWLLNYKGAVWSRLGRKHPLSKIVPFLYEVTPGEYVTILDRFIRHWTRVNGALPAGSPMLLGTRTLANLQTIHNTIKDKQSAIEEADDGDLALLRARRDAFFGDVPEEDREEDSIIADLLAYTDYIRANYSGTPIADSLPRIFPKGPDSLPRFRFNWSQSVGSALQVWLEVPEGTDASQVYLKEGSAEQTQPLYIGANNITMTAWQNITVAGEVDDFELRDADGDTVAQGHRDEAFAMPQ